MDKMRDAVTAQFLGRSTIVFTRFDIYSPPTSPKSFPVEKQSNPLRTDDPSLPKRGPAEIVYRFKSRAIRGTYATEPEMSNYSVVA